MSDHASVTHLLYTGMNACMLSFSVSVIVRPPDVTCQRFQIQDKRDI